MNIQLRDAAPSDSEFVFHVTREAIGPYVELTSGWDDERERERHGERWRRHRYRVIVTGGADAGYVATAVYEQPTGDYPRSLYLHQLMVLPPFQSRGIGAACLGRVQAEARDIQLPLRLRVLRVNPRALAFYLAHGGQVVAESESHLSLEWPLEDAG